VAVTIADYSAAVAPSTPVRRRRQPEEARAEILTAAHEQLAAAPLAALTVSSVMARTTLSRKAFYVYFDDLGALLVALVRPLREGTDAAMATWRSAADPVTTGRAALRAAAALYREHGPLLEAILRSPTDDPAVLTAREELTAPLRQIAEDLLVRRGDLSPDAAATVATALATMNVQTLLDRAPGANDEQLDALTDGIAWIWERAVGVPPSTERGRP
jgi:AcrR family transcriptional regulator